MEENKSNYIYEKNEYLFKILYLIRKNLPKSEILYLLMFLLKYFGLILFSISLNVFDTSSSDNNNMNKNPDDGGHMQDNSGDINRLSDFLFKSDQQMNGNDKERNNNNSNNSNSSSNSSNNMVQSIFKKLLINGNNYKILNNSYQIICLVGFTILIIYVFIWIFTIFYMRKKYFNKVSITITDKKIKEINQSDIYEKRLIKVLTYILFLIVFFHQYILEYYTFGFLGYIIDLFGSFTISEGNNNNEYLRYINDHLNNLILPEILIVFTNFITIAIILFTFVLFILINSSKTLYINNNYPLYSDPKNLIIYIITLNLNPIFGITNYFNDDVKLKIVLVFVIIIILLMLIKITINYYYYSPLPDRLNYLCIFIEFFALFGCITNLLTYLTKSEINSTKFSIIKAVFELLNAFVFTLVLLRKKNERSLKIFSQNLFCNNYKTLNPSGIYYYISCYLKYSQNRENNYMEIFKLIQTHVLDCNKKECPGHLLLPKSLSYSIFTDLKHYSDASSNSNQKDTPKKDNIISKKDDKEEKKGENNEEKKEEKSSTIIKKSLLKSLKSKENINIKSIKTRRKSYNIDIYEKEVETNSNENINKKFLEDVEFKIIGEQEIINRINFLYRRKKYDYLQIYIFIHLQYIIKIKQNYRLALYFLGKYSLSEIKFSFLSQYCLYEIKTYICGSIFNKSNTNLIKDPYIKKYKEENLKLEQLMDYISLFNIVRKIIKISCESIIQFYSFRRELHNSLSLQKYKKTKIYPVLQSSEKIQSSIFKLKYLLDKLNKEKKQRLESVELSYLICNFFKLLEGRIPQDVLGNVKPLLYFRDSLYDQLINEFYLFMINNPLIVVLTEKDSFNIIYFTNIFMKKLGFSFSDLKYKDFHEKLFPGNQELIKEHSLILKQFLFFHSNSYSKFNTFIKSKEGYLVSINFECKIFPSFMNDFLFIANVKFNDETDKDYKNNNNNASSVFESSNIKDKKDKNINNNKHNKLANTYSFILNNDYEIFSLTKNFFIEYKLNQSMFRELRINFCQFFCIDENKLSKQVLSERKKLLKEKPNLNNQISLKESNKAYTIFQNISMKNIFKIREEKIVATYNYPEMFIYEKIDKKKLIKKIPEIINIIDEIGLDYDWYIRLQNYKDRLTMNMDISNITFNTFNSDQFFEAIFGIKKLGSIIYFVVNLNEIYNRQIEIKDFNNRFLSKNSILSNTNKSFKKMGTKSTTKFSRGSLKTMDDKNRRTASNSFFSSNSSILFQKVNKNDTLKKAEKNRSVSTTVINNRIINFKEEEKKEKEKDKIDKGNFQSKKTQKNSLYDNSEYLKNFKRKRRQTLEDDENTPLITKDIFNDTLMKSNKKNKILTFILYSFILIALVLILGNTIQSITGVNENLKVLDMTINFEILKVDIYLESILIMHYCVIENKNPFMLQLLPDIQKTKLEELMEHLKDVQEHINTIISNRHSVGIFKVIEERFNIYVLGDDWELTTRKVDILEETRRLSYVIGAAIGNDSGRCNFDAIYHYSASELSDFIKSGIRPSLKQKLFFYFILNILSNYKATFEKLSEECASSLGNMWGEYQKTHLYIIITVIVVLLIFLIIYCIKYCLDTSFYQLLFLYYYKIEIAQKKFETQIYYLYKTNLEFNFDNIKYFEYIKSNCDSESTDFCELTNKINNNIYNSKKRNDEEKKGKNNDKEQNRMNGSLLNASMNGSSIQFLNKSNKLNLNNRIENNNNTPFGSKIDENEEKGISQEETIDSLMKFIINILPNSHRFSLIFIIINIIFYLGICAFGVYEIYKQLNKYEFAINLSMNILERVPRIMELVLYSSIAVILNQTNLISPDSHQSPYIKYFQIDSLYYSEEMIQTYFKDSLYGQILKDNLKLKYNLEYYLFNNKYSLFQKVQYWETQLNTIGDFCINLPKGQMLTSINPFEVNISSLYEVMEMFNEQSLICKTQAPGMKDTGIKIEFNFILQEITTKYIEFVIYNRLTEEKLSQARLKFIDNQDFEKVMSDVKMTFTFYFNTIINALREDFEKQNADMTNTQSVYSCLFIIINLEIAISLIIVFLKGERYKKLFSYFSTIPKDEIINI